MKTAIYAWPLAISTMFASIPSAMATNICLESKVNGKKIYGELLSFTGEQWELTTDFGRMKLTIDDAFPCDDTKVTPPISTPASPDRISIPAPILPDGTDRGRLKTASASSAPSGTTALENPIENELRIVGSNTIGARLIPHLATQLLKRDVETPKISNPLPYETVVEDNKRKLRIEAKGSSTGFRALQHGEAELAMSSRPIKDEEVVAIANAGQPGMRDPGREIVLALDGVVPIVAADSGLKDISLLQLQQLFSGAVVNWSELGLGDAAVAVHARDDRSGTYDTFYSLVLEPDGVQLTSNAKRYTSNEELAAEVATNPNAIGFVAAGALSKVGPGVRALALKGDCGIVQQPNTFNIKTEDYALGRRLFLYSIRADRTGLAREFVDFAVSDAAQAHIVQTGFISQAIATLDGNDYRRRLSEVSAISNEPNGAPLVRQLRDMLRNAQRLSVTFRFQIDSSILDNKARQDGTRLARYLQTNASERDLLLIGFADNTGDFSHNIKLSQQRAREAEALLRNNGISARRITTIGMSELLPAFCNTAESGRARNRRVEVWLR